jgi:hypothetical protein
VDTTHARKTKVILHFGAHKTGTSLIQKFMRDRKEILSRLGIVFVSRSESDELIGWGTKFRTNPKPLQQQVHSLAESGCRYIVISHENSLGKPFSQGSCGLYNKSGEQINAFAEALSNYDLTFIYYIRRQWEFVESYYIQTVHQGSSKTFKEWYTSIGGSANLSWRPLVENLRMIQGGSTIIKDFGTLVENGQEWYLKDFFECFIDTESIPPVEYKSKRNISVGETGLKMLRAANMFTDTAAERKLLRKFFQLHFNNLNYPRPNLLNPEEQMRIKEKYASELVELLKNN